ncbi:hypothetical protein HPC62_20715 [Thermoleptolyngbya sichuanensis A183]|uniref:Uncharacterized protein n=1 Tax=Thermoleptolyngbya sichuanensis A183 TaxID=2737172 RepID=A0A6M8BBB6_9CYAN|nr:MULTISPECIES: hypothetical protein [Thermoleptolyngbya]QKD84274.1 hypothetical protein HPC62_20715 [Thermoleptolyngbya sichuanensis A183]
MSHTSRRVASGILYHPGEGLLLHPPSDRLIFQPSHMVFDEATPANKGEALAQAALSLDAQRLDRNF